MAGEAHVADIDPFELNDIESERVYRFFSSGPDWSAPTRCEGWSVRDLLAHVCGVENYHLACLDDAIGALFEEASKHGVTDVHSFNQWEVDRRADRSTDDVLAEWREKNLDVRKRMRELGRDASMASSVGPYPVGLMACHIASEYATHADDMDVEIPDAEQAGRAAWRHKVSRLALEEYDKPVELDDRGDHIVVRMGAEEITLTETDFVEAVSARLPAGYPISDELRTTLVALA